MQSEAMTWALVLAAGEGTRLRSLTTTPSGAAIPKQFCSLRNGPSLLEEALDREMFRVVAADSRTGCIEIQYFDGDLEEDWRLSLESVRTLEEPWQSYAEEQETLAECAS